MRISNDLRLFLELCVPEGKSPDTCLTRADECGIGAIFRAAYGISDPQWEARHACLIAAWLESTRTVLETLDGMRVIVLKGIPLSFVLHGCDDARHTTDIDLWLHKNDIDDAAQRLEKIGYTRHESSRQWTTNQLQLVHETLMPVELHWALTQPPLLSPDFDSAWGRSVAETYGDCRARENMAPATDRRFDGLSWHRLGDSDTRIHLLLHAMQHIGAVKPWADLAAASSLHATHDELRDFGLSRLERLVREAICPVGKIPHIEVMAAKAFRIYYRGILASKRGDLIPEDPSKLETAQIILSRAASTICLDGILYPAQALAFHAKLVAAVIAEKVCK